MYCQKSIDINFVYKSVEIIEELDSKQRKIRSLRGFFLYALEIMEKGKNHEILQTNLQSFFWRKVKNTIRQNKKAALQEFLFGEYTVNKSDNQGSNPTIQILENQIQSLHNKVDSLQQKIIQLESKLDNPKYPLSDALEAPNDIKITQHGNYTMGVKKGPYLTENDNQIKNPTYKTKDIESKSLSYAPRSPLKILSGSQEYSMLSNQEKGLNEQNFITLSNLSEDQKIEIIKLGFQLQARGTISLKKYYESTEPNSLFQLKGYSIKYESIRRTKIYQQLK